jgi:putative permease
MFDILKKWYERHFSNPESVILVLSLIVLFFLLQFFGNMLLPALASLVIAYLLQGVVNTLERCRFPHILSVILVYLGFIGLLVLACLVLLPKLWRQLANLFNEIPVMITKAQTALMLLPQRYPNFISGDQIQSVLDQSKNQLTELGKMIFSVSLSSIPGLIEIIIYVVLVPLLVYFFLMDKKKLVGWLQHYIPSQRGLLIKVWSEVNQQIGNYVRGKVIEVVIVAVACYIVFIIMDLQYAMLLAVLVGLSVIIPFIGAVVVTIPIVVVALMQWGVAPEFWYLILAYAIIITIDANVLVPVLFSEVMNLHPVAIIIAILIFGGIWGFWGVFFAIPLATVVKAVLSTWQ